MGEEVAVLGEVACIDGVLLKGVDADVGDGGGEEEGEHEGPGASDLGDEEGGHEGRLHDSGHDGGHADEGEGGGVESVETSDGDEHVGEIAGESAHDEGGTEGASNTARADGDGCGDGFEEDEQEEIDDDDQWPVVSGQLPVTGGQGFEDAVLEEGLDAAVEELGEGGVAFAEEGWEEEDHEAEEDATYDETGTLGLECGHPLLHSVGDAEEIDGGEGADDAEDEVVGDLADTEYIFDLEGELDSVAHEEVGDGGGAEGGEEEGYGCCAGEVEHEDFDDEKDSCDGGFEDACDGTCGTAPEEEPDALGLELEEASDVGTYGAACGGDGGFESDAAAEGDGEGGGDEGGVGVACGKDGAFARDGIEHLGEAVAYLAFDDIFDKEDGEQDADGGVEEHEDVAAEDGGPADTEEALVDEMDEVLQRDGGEA